LILVNYKTYLESTGKGGLEIARAAESVTKETGTCIVVAPQFVDIKPIAERFDVPVFAQHVDGAEPGAFTGHILAEAVKNAGASGVMINHSERRLRLSEVDEANKRARGIGLVSAICANTATVAEAAASLHPDMVAIEPPELIGTGVAVSKAKPEIVSDTVLRIKRVNAEVYVLCGAGVTRAEDVEAAIRLGASGVLLATGVVKAKDVRLALLEMAQQAAKAHDHVRA